VIALVQEFKVMMPQPDKQRKDEKIGQTPSIDSAPMAQKYPCILTRMVAKLQGWVNRFR
jgi:hypothetical protein